MGDANVRSKDRTHESWPIHGYSNAPTLGYSLSRIQATKPDLETTSAYAADGTLLQLRRVSGETVSTLPSWPEDGRDLGHGIGPEKL